MSKFFTIHKLKVFYLGLGLGFSLFTTFDVAPLPPRPRPRPLPTSSRHFSGFSLLASHGHACGSRLLSALLYYRRQTSAQSSVVSRALSRRGVARGAFPRCSSRCSPFALAARSLSALLLSTLGCSLLCPTGASLMMDWCTIVPLPLQPSAASRLLPVASKELYKTSASAKGVFGSPLCSWRSLCAFFTRHFFSSWASHQRLRKSTVASSLPWLSSRPRERPFPPPPAFSPPLFWPFPP